VLSAARRAAVFLRSRWKGLGPVARWSWGTFLTLMGLLGTIVAFLPNIEIGTHERLRKRDMLTTPFTVKNGSVLPVYRVQLSCQIDSLTTTLRQIIRNVRPVNRRLIDDALDPGETISFSCAIPNWTGNIIGTVGRQTYVRLSIEIGYRPVWFLPIDRRFTAGYEAVPGDDDLLQWIHVEAIPIWRPTWED
jgi:hypothetical protein